LLLGIDLRSARRATDGRSRLGNRGVGGPLSDQDPTRLTLNIGCRHRSCDEQPSECQRQS